MTYSRARFGILALALLALVSSPCGSDETDRSKFNQNNRDGDDSLNAEVAAQIRGLLSAAAASPKSDFRSAGGRAGIDAFDNQSLTVVVLVGIENSGSRNTDLRLTMTTARSPSDILDQLSGSSDAMSVLRPEFVKAVTCEVADDTAQGQIRFAVSELCEGAVLYKANKTDGAWKIIEFRFPNLGWTTTRLASGKWKAAHNQEPAKPEIPAQEEPTHERRNDRQPSEVTPSSSHDAFLEELKLLHAKQLDEVAEAEKAFLKQLRADVQKWLAAHEDSQKQIADLKAANRKLEEQQLKLLEEFAIARRLIEQHDLAAGAARPKVEGVVTGVNQQHDLVEISLGEDDGLKEAMTLEVFRLGDKPTYLGRISLLKVTAEKAVGQIIAKPDNATIKPGDRVTSSLVANEQLPSKIRHLQGGAVDAQPDGRIASVNHRNRVVRINLGAADGLPRQRIFRVFNRDDLEMQNAKARIEVTRIIEDHLAEARILDDDLADPILADDIIVAAAGGIRFAIAGFIDIDKDGKSDRDALRSLIFKNGGTVAAELREDGTKEGQLTVDTKYLILGDSRQDATVEQSTALASFVAKAKELGVEAISVQRAVGLMTSVDARRATPEAPDVFRPRTESVPPVFQPRRK